MRITRAAMQRAISARRELPNCGVVPTIKHDGSVRVFEQDYRPAFQIGDPVLVDGGAFLWN